MSEGIVSRDTVISVLEKALYNSDTSIIHNENKVTLILKGIPEVFIIPEVVGRRMIGRIANRYSVRIEYFYHPEMILEQ